MAATQTDLATRVLKKIRVLGSGQPADSEDLLVAKQKLRAVHASIRKDDRVRWTIQTLPEAAEEPYVLMASFLTAPEFGKPADQNWWTWGEREITALVQAPSSGQPVRAEYF
ncbi:hypothetical protein [Burkholderia gladioli]|uniref:hypothetical protein n=1 Tax=Burkholderia gladioli TaxID=28095 RepID=UPI001640D64F|nr:hypothetical protein [Burkholderia gladioli]